MKYRRHLLIAITLTSWAFLDAKAGSEAPNSHRAISVADYSTLQAAIDANPGRSIYVPAGEYQLDRQLRISADYTELIGPGRLVQTNPDCSIVRVENASFVRISGLILTRPADNLVTSQEGIKVIDSQFVEIEDVRVIDNRGPAGSIRVTDSRDCTIRDCIVYNYMFVTVEDRTSNPRSGIAFRVIDGTGIVVANCEGMILSGNRVVDENIIPTREFQKRHDLGRIVKKASRRGVDVDPVTWEREVVGGNWHQGSGVYLQGDKIQLLGNYIRNAAQGVDIQGDHVAVQANMFDNCAVGIKVIHGSKCDVIANNQVVAPSLWGIVVSGGTNSHYAVAATADKPAIEANLPGQIVIANNIVSEFGAGNASWIWDQNRNQAAIFLACDIESPLLTDVVVSGNIVHNDAAQRQKPSDLPRISSRKYEYAFLTSQDEAAPRSLRVFGNILDSGRQGVSNHELQYAPEVGDDSFKR